MHVRRTELTLRHGLDKFPGIQIELMVLSMATYTGSVEAIADEVAEFTEERAQARVRAR
jgi:hypothetical protein